MDLLSESLVDLINRYKFDKHFLSLKIIMKTWGLGYEKSKEKAKQIYKKIGIIHSPALGDEVTFSNTGFNHLIRKGRIPRPKNEQKRRFTLLDYVEAIVRNPRTTITYKQEERKVKINRHGEKLLKTSTIYFWKFIEKVDGCEIKVIISQVEGGKKHFLSVMGDEIVIDNKIKKDRH